MTQDSKVKMKNTTSFPLHIRQMWWREIQIATLLVVVLFGAAHAKPKIESDGGYTDIVMAISPDLTESKCGDYIQKIQDLMTDASTLLQNATQDKVYFQSVTVVLPIGWQCPDISVSLPQSGESWAMATVKVGSKHPIFKNNPWTRQPRGCRQEGDFIYISEDFITSNMDQYGPKGQVMVHEWAKYRWGVFEEYGHLFDSIYPPGLAVNTSWKPNYCSNVPLIATPHNWIRSDCQVASECLFDINEDDNTDVTSSLMALPFLSSVEHFCTNDVHNEDLPSKQNAMCNGLSTWDVIKEHPDIKEQSSDPKEVNTAFRFVQAKVALVRYAIVLQKNAVMKEVRSRWEYLRDITKQMIRLLLPDDAVVYLITFDETVTADGQGTLSDISEREKLVAKVPLHPSDSTGRSVDEAVKKAADLLGSDVGTIILVMDCLKVYKTDTIAHEAGVHRVWPILYPRDGDVVTKPYEDIASQTNGQSCIVTQELSGKIQNTTNYMALSGCFQSVLSGIIQQVDAGNCSDACTVELNVGNNWGGKGWISIYYNSIDLSGIEKEEVTGPESKAPSLNKYNTYHWAEIDPLEGTWSVKIKMGPPLDTVYVDIIGEIPAAIPSNASLEVWASQDLSNLEYSSESAPILFTSVIDQSSQIVLGAYVEAAIDGTKTRLKDNGLGADITGNDGIYSAYILGSTAGEISVTVTANNNEGQANVVQLTRAVPNPPFVDPVCCGSILNITNTVPAAAFSLSRNVIANIRNSLPSSFPPSPVRDLIAEPADYNARLTFTASGKNLDQGTADEIKVEYWELGNKTGTHQSQQFNNSIASGSLTTIIFKPPCNMVLVFTVSPIGMSNREALPSNRAHALIPCAPPPPPKPDPTDNSPETLDAGAIIGIIIGVLLVILIIALIVYLVLNRDHLDELLIWKWLTCKSCREERIKNRTSKKQNDVIRRKVPPSKPVESVADLYAKPDLAAKHKGHTEADDDDDDGGFAKSNYQVTNNLDQPSPYNDQSSQNSSIPQHETAADLPINIVGLPAYDNYGYSGMSSTSSLAQQGYEGGYNNGFTYNGLNNNPGTVAYAYDPRGNEDYVSVNPANADGYYVQPSAYIQPVLPNRKPHLKTEV
ncbi:calcium-activated chloride channel regulator 1-like [Oratosquilla oratoria]|uniref:calcium-activated chloride channel regulator 1-like n=1 Tax=Oratosquilla oratoria TaxID=337810 RepID=UPI003F776E8C